MFSAFQSMDEPISKLMHLSRARSVAERGGGGRRENEAAFLLPFLWSIGAMDRPGACNVDQRWRDAASIGGVGAGIDGVHFRGAQATPLWPLSPPPPYRQAARTPPRSVVSAPLNVGAPRPPHGDHGGAGRHLGNRDLGRGFRPGLCSGGRMECLLRWGWRSWGGGAGPAFAEPTWGLTTTWGPSFLCTYTYTQHRPEARKGEAARGVVCVRLIGGSSSSSSSVVLFPKHFLYINKGGGGK